MIPPCVPRHRSFSEHPDLVSTRRASGLSFVAQPINPTVLWWTVPNPACRLRSWATTLPHVYDFVLLFLPPCGPYLIPLSHRFHWAEPTCPFTPRMPNKAKTFRARSNQAATSTCNTQPRVLSPHHVVNHSPHQGATIHQSLDAPILNLPLDECIDNTHSNQFREKRKKEKTRTKNSNKWSKAKQKPKQDHLREKNLGPLRQGQRINTTEIKCSKIADSSRWGKRARHHRQKSTTKN
jgi:hypothetical protein